MNRSSIFYGTTNQQDFLNDGTGNRRFWVVPATKEIPTDTLIKKRDRICAAPPNSIKVAWHLTPEENAAMSESRTAYESADVWEDPKSSQIAYVSKRTSKTADRRCDLGTF
jgi:predicted P-loop ATPase